MRLDVFLHLAHERDARLARVEAKLDRLLALQAEEAMELDTLHAEVERNASVTDSAVTLLTGIAAQLAALVAAGDPAKIAEFAAQLSGNTDKLAAAVTANTPPTP
jgi:hypothetical protein